MGHKTNKTVQENQRGRMLWEVGGRFQMEGTYVYLWLIHVDVWQKPIQYCRDYPSIKKHPEDFFSAYLPSLSSLPPSLLSSPSFLCPFSPLKALLLATEALRPPGSEGSNPSMTPLWSSSPSFQISKSSWSVHRGVLAPTCFCGYLLPDWER